MKIEFLISTMNRNDISFLYDIFLNNNINEINILVINQCTNIELPKIECPHDGIRVISVKGKGLSKSRNIGLKNAKGDIVLPTDDDVVFKPDILNLIQYELETNKDFDVLTFRIDKDSNIMFKEYRNISFKHTKLTILKVSSVEIIIKLKSVLDKGVFYDENFGLGAKYNTGEENIFLRELLQRGCIIKYIPKTIATHPDIITSGEILDSDMLLSKGAVFANMWGIIAIPISFLFIIKKRRELLNISMWRALFLIQRGVLNYLLNKYHNE